MAMAVEYRGEFLSSDGARYKVEILKDGYSGSVKELHFPYYNPLEISWSEVSKIDTVQGSSATLTVISDTDREFLDLYTVTVGSVRLDVYRNGNLYWSGTIDTELYEEPFNAEKDYDVTLTFSDCAILERLNWEKTGRISLYDIIEECLDKTGINYHGIVTYISTMESLYTPLDLQDVYILNENFYDEEGAGMTYRAVLESILLPFAMHMVQKDGMIFIFDLNALSALDATMIQQDAEDSALGVDKIYNNVTVSFSPYADATMMKGKVERDVSLTSSAGGLLFYMNYQKDSYARPSSPEGFRLHHNTTMKSNLILSNGARFFQINPIYSAEECEGVIMSLKNALKPAAEDTSQLFNRPKDCGTLGQTHTETIITCPRVYLGYTSFRRTSFRLRLNLSLLYDTRYNPFEEATEYNDGQVGRADGAYKNLQDWSNFAYVPIKLTLEDEAGNALYHYENYRTLESSGYTVKGSWVSGAASWGHAYLCYYDKSDRKSASGLGGWKGNRMMIGYYRGELPQLWDVIEDGDFIDLPPAGGYLKLEIGSGLHQFDYRREVKDIYSITRWVAYKEPSITICSSNYKPLETKDVENKAWINRIAKEELELSTIVGTLPISSLGKGIPNAKAQLYDANGNIHEDFVRAGKSGSLERLLIGTIYSQYATRHSMLSGTMILLPSFGVFSHSALQGKYILTREVQNLRAGTSDITMVELSEDNYEGVDYE